MLSSVEPSSGWSEASVNPTTRPPRSATTCAAAFQNSSSVGISEVLCIRNGRRELTAFVAGAAQTGYQREIVQTATHGTKTSFGSQRPACHNIVRSPMAQESDL